MNNWLILFGIYISYIFIKLLHCVKWCLNMPWAWVLPLASFWSLHTKWRPFQCAPVVEASSQQWQFFVLKSNHGSLRYTSGKGSSAAGLTAGHSSVSRKWPMMADHWSLTVTFEAAIIKDGGGFTLEGWCWCLEGRKGQLRKILHRWCNGPGWQRLSTLLSTGRWANMTGSLANMKLRCVFTNLLYKKV